MPRFKIHHLTRYRYNNLVRNSANQIMLYPVNDNWQQVVKHELVISGDPQVALSTDFYLNRVGIFMNIEPHQFLAIDSRLEMITVTRQMPDETGKVQYTRDQLPHLVNSMEHFDFLRQEEFLAEKEVMELDAMKRALSLDVYNAVKCLNEYVYQHFQYHTGVTTVETTIDEVWSLKAGVCQDFAHILLVMMRMIGVPARYVSGYICPNNSSMRGEGATHAWVEAYIPGYGWLGVDPTNNCLVNDFHVRLAVGRSFPDCSPVKGTYTGEAEHELEVGVSVSYDDQPPSTEQDSPLLTSYKAAPAKKSPAEMNSFQAHKEMMMAQQQQQQQ